MHRPVLTLLALAGALATAVPATADPSFSGHVSVGASLYPDYDGSSIYSPVPYLDAQLNDGNYFARMEGGGLGFNLIDNSDFHAGPLFGYRRGRGVVGDAAVSAMRDIDYSVTAGGFVEYGHVAQDPRSGEQLSVSFADGVFNTQTGWTVSVSAMAHRPLVFIDDGLIASLEADATWSDQTYMQTYFGVSPTDSTLSGLPVFNARSGVENAGVSLALDQFLSRNWSIGLRLHYARLLDAAADSPVTAIAGSPNQFFGGVAVGWAF